MCSLVRKMQEGHVKNIKNTIFVGVGLYGSNIHLISSNVQNSLQIWLLHLTSGCRGVEVRCHGFGPHPAVRVHGRLHHRDGGRLCWTTHWTQHVVEDPRHDASVSPALHGSSLSSKDLFLMEHILYKLSNNILKKDRLTSLSADKFSYWKFDFFLPDTLEKKPLLICVNDVFCQIIKSCFVSENSVRTKLNLRQLFKLLKSSFCRKKHPNCKNINLTVSAAGMCSSENALLWIFSIWNFLPWGGIDGK